MFLRGTPPHTLGTSNFYSSKTTGKMHDKEKNWFYKKVSSSFGNSQRYVT
jgi:hypothetical protein